MRVRMSKRNIFGKEYDIRILYCTSEKDAETVCLNRKGKYGLIGRYYCETSSGHLFQI